LLRIGGGLIILAIGIYAVFFSLLTGLLVIGVGLFTAFEGVAGWTLAAALTEAWIKPEAEAEEIEFFS